MSEALRPLARPRLYEQVVQRLREHVADSGLGAGDRLPPERQLAERLGVSRASVKQAIVVLEVQGLVEVRHGGGTYLRRGRLDAEPVEELVARKRRLPDVLEAREALETKLAELAAERRTDEDLAEIDAALADMRAQIESGDRGEAGDQRFHAAVTAAAHSSMLAEFMRTIAAEIAESREESLRQPNRPSKSLAQHERIAEAIRDRQPRAAVTAMRRHLRTVSRVRLLSWDPDAED
ncbi:GntR family transcriptional regulator [Saccharopolyspora erythraea NRRL 2338]|uniref:GntR-family transcriptional regulator n=2 Tax=Saccharopolyspora erythraea TaxID=1836 RepID=A4FGF5_SACEN|nr:FadR/GntR family transcriptional regulator [Saccharopolyspora erythraea]EQD83944.1 GntR family transcriptional regulator [Saccharopolyspora erythraea D]PFG96835.1 GntR family transcriptional regulator [Saccharopolyspora erythraea NRRL 2338]QRK87074.1 FadR family transcriptional regulator [Saccharopolyspora erythraea]CAM03130.1 GntR-family transcriptional regulator [Saccharopolyspora erythraea NRRL 2338]